MIKKVWRVRVYRKVEVWVDVQADDSTEAEVLAGNLPNVLSVFNKSAMRGDRPVDSIPLAAVEDRDISDG